MSIDLLNAIHRVTGHKCNENELRYIQKAAKCADQPVDQSSGCPYDYEGLSGFEKQSVDCSEEHAKSIITRILSLVFNTQQAAIIGAIDFICIKLRPFLHLPMQPECRKAFEEWLDNDASPTTTARSKYYTAQEQVLGWLSWEAGAAWASATERESGVPSIGLAVVIKDAFFEGFGIGDVMAEEKTIEGFWEHSQAKASIPPLLPEIEDREGGNG